MGQSHDPYDGDAQAKAKAAKALRERLAIKDARDSWRWLMGNERGRHIVWTLLDKAGVFKSTFDPNALWMAFREGNRNLGLALWAEIQTHCPDLYPAMVAENKTDGGADDSRTNPN